MKLENGQSEHLTSFPLSDLLIIFAFNHKSALTQALEKSLYTLFVHAQLPRSNFLGNLETTVYVGLCFSRSYIIGSLQSSHITVVSFGKEAVFNQVVLYTLSKVGKPG